MDIDSMHPGPRNPSLLHLQASHRSTEVWRVGGGDSQRCRRRNPNHTRLPNLHHRMFPLLQSTGFYGIARVSSLQLDWSIIAALVERWRPETHSFHLPMGECTITLQDVALLIGLPVDGAPVIGVTPGPGISWSDLVESVFGHKPEGNRFNGARLQLSWFQDQAIVPHNLPENASEEELRHYTRSYLLQLIAGCLFTDHSGGLVHCMWIPYLQDLDACGGYAWGAAVLAFLYRELCKSCMTDREEVAGCLLLLQLWAWERLPTIAPLHTDLPLVDEDFWTGHLAGPLGARWLVSHSFLEKTGRTLSVLRVTLDELAPSHFIWMPYSMDVTDSLPSYCLTGRHIWRYRGPMICIFIVEPHMVDRVSRQFGMFQSIPVDVEYSKDQHRLTLQGNTSVNWVQKHQQSINIWNSHLDHIFESELIIGDSTVPNYHVWYIERTRRFHSRMGGLHAYIGDLLKTIAERTESILQDVCHLATDGWHHIQDRSLYGLFEAFPLDECRDKEMEGRQVAGRRPKRGGHGGGRGGVRRRGNGRVVDQVVPLDHGGDDHDAVHFEDDYDAAHLGDNHDAAHLGDDHDSLVHVENHNVGGSFHVAETIAESDSLQNVLQANPPPIQQPIQPPTVQRSNQPTHHPRDVIPSWNFGLTPGGSLIPTPPPVDQPSQPPIVQQSHQSTNHPIDVIPSWNFGLTPGGSLIPTPQPVEQPIQLPTLHRTHQTTHHPISSIPSFDLGLTPSDGGNVEDGNGGSLSQSTQSPEISPTTDTNEPSNLINPTDPKADRFEKVYEPRRSKRLCKPTNCGTAGKKCIKRN